MRISNNFNNYNIQTFKAIRVSEDAEPIINELLEKNMSVAKKYSKLEDLSDTYDTDIFIQKIRTNNGLNLQAIDPYTQETLCFLAGDKDPEKAIKCALNNFNDFVQKQASNIKEPIYGDKYIKTSSSGNGTENGSTAAKLFKLFNQYFIKN